MRCSVSDSVGDEIFQISPPNSPEKALRSAFDALFWFKKMHRVACHALTAAIRPGTPISVMALFML